SRIAGAMSFGCGGGAGCPWRACCHSACRWSIGSICLSSRGDCRGCVPRGRARPGWPGPGGGSANPARQTGGCDAVILCVLGRQLVGGGNVSEQVCGALPLPVGLGFCVGHVGHGSSLWDVVGGQSRWAIMRLTSASASAQS